MNCPRCTTSNPEGADFCMKCAAPLTPAAAARMGLDPLDIAQTDLGFPRGLLLIERFRIEKQIGYGGMGRVYLAHDAVLGEQVAIKVMRELLSRDAGAVKRLAAEARASMKLAHPNVVRVHDYHDAPIAKFLAMEYVEGETLKDRLDREGKLPEGEARRIGVEICKGLEHAHARKVIHRDLKPANVLLGKDGSIKIADFGIARVCRDSMTRLTSVQDSGTLPYMSPEQMMGESNELSDIYSLGVILYEMLSGDPPFHTGEIAEQIRSKAPRPLAGVSAEMNALVLRCLEKDAARRFRSAAELREELDGTARRRREEAQAKAEEARRREEEKRREEARRREEERRRREEEERKLREEQQRRQREEAQRKQEEEKRRAEEERRQSEERAKREREEEEKRRKAKLLAEQETRKRNRAVAAAALILVGGALAVYLATRSPEPRAVEPAASPIEPVPQPTVARPEPAAVPQKEAKRNDVEMKRLLDRGREATGVRNWEQAIAYYDLALEMDPANKEALSGKARAQKAREAERAAAKPAPVVAPSAEEIALRAELALWENIKAGSDPAVFEDYLRRYPSGQFAEPARSKIRSIAIAGQKEQIRARMDAGDWKGALERIEELLRTAPEDVEALSWKSRAVQQIEAERAAAQRAEEERRAAEQAEAERRAAAGRSPGKNSIGMEFVYIPPGRFEMGCSLGDYECDADENPRHPVEITRGFELGKYEVTQEEWDRVMGTKPSHFKGGRLPVEQVSWNDAQEFIARLNKLNDGYVYRLPTEAEWEYAARAGTTGKYYGELDRIAWYDGNSGRTTHPVGQKQPNAFGLYDMLGNVWEWCSDWYDEGYYGKSPAKDPKGLGSGNVKVLRGGSWYDVARGVRVSNRFRYNPVGRVNDDGLRVAREKK